MIRYACACSLSGTPVDPASVRALNHRLGGTSEYSASVAGQSFTGMIAREDPRPIWPCSATYGGFVGVGDVRLDNRTELAQLLNPPSRAQSDIGLVLQLLADFGPSVISQFCGDFSFVAWDAEKHELLAARDAFGVKRLFYGFDRDVLHLSSSLSPWSQNGDFNPGYAACYLTGALRKDSGATVWRGCRAVAAGTYVMWGSGGSSERRFWPPGEFNAAAGMSETDQVERFQSLVLDAVSVRLSCSTWSELSGGLDTAVVVAASHSLFQTGRALSPLAGTYSFVDRMAGAEERPFIDATLDRYPLRNEQIADAYPWQGDADASPITEEPRPFYPYWARDQAANKIVSGAGATTVLSGGGSDFYLTGGAIQLADLISQGELRAAMQGAVAMGAMARDSMWKLLWRYGITPLLPDSIRSRLVDATVSVPHWIDRRFARRWEVGKQIPAALPRIEGCYSHQTAGALRGLSSVADSLELPVSRFTVEKRYPFLDRRLVEFALSLPANMIFRLGTSKWILRKAVAESVPEIIRDRRSKGWIDGRLCRTLAQHPSFVAELIRDPLVAQAGWVDPVALRREVSRAAAGAVSGTLALMRTLSLESWLRAREGSPLCANG